MNFRLHSLYSCPFIRLHTSTITSSLTLSTSESETITVPDSYHQYILCGICLVLQRHIDKLFNFWLHTGGTHQTINTVRTWKGWLDYYTVFQTTEYLRFTLGKSHLLISINPHFPGQRISGRWITKANLEPDPYHLDILYKRSVNTEALLDTWQL